MRLKNYITEQATGGGGQTPGKLEIDSISLQQALDYINKHDFDISMISNFEENFIHAQRKSNIGWTKRKDMPVIETEDVRKLQQRLKKGNLDINEPFSNDTNPGNPFPEGLSGLEAENFLKNGLRDGSLKDDKIDVRITSKKVKNLKPIQKQIYFDKVIDSIMKFGVEASLDFIQHKSFFIVSEDDYIIDGHHRFLSAMLIDPNIAVNCLMIDLPLNKLLPLSLSYSAAIGRKRNL